MKKSSSLRFSLTLLAALFVNVCIILILRAFRQSNRVAALVTFSGALLFLTQLLLRFLFKKRLRLYELAAEHFISIPKVVPKAHKENKAIKIIISGFTITGILIGTLLYYSSKETLFFAIIDTLVVLLLVGSIFAVIASTTTLLLRVRRPA